ncbi:MAG: hypothetical protein M3Y82_11785 [Verrucomicrobiota bacterium]|nr:hypothetical protein [Verrucomicrobiota bacterium]
MFISPLKLFKPLVFTGIISVTGIIPPLFAGEKIEFSKPEKSQAPQQDSVRRFPGAVNRGNDSVSDSMMPGAPPMPSPQPGAPSKKEQQARDEKKNWLFATPENHAKTVENAFKVKDYDSDPKETKSVIGSYLKNEKHAPPTTENSTEDEKQDGNKRRTDSLAPADPAGFKFDKPARLSAAAAAAAAANGVGGFLHERGSSDFRQDIAQERRDQFNQLFEARKDPINSLADPSRQPVNPVVAAPSDLLERNSRSSFSDPFKNSPAPLTGVPHHSVLDDMNSRALGRRDSPDASLPTLQPTRVKAQPAILPFPTRPGELLKRPGSF